MTNNTIGKIIEVFNYIKRYKSIYVIACFVIYSLIVIALLSIKPDYTEIKLETNSNTVTFRTSKDFDSRHYFSNIEIADLDICNKVGYYKKFGERTRKLGIDNGSNNKCDLYYDENSIITISKSNNELTITVKGDSLYGEIIMNKGDAWLYDEYDEDTLKLLDDNFSFICSRKKHYPIRMIDSSILEINPISIDSISFMNPLNNNRNLNENTLNNMELILLDVDETISTKIGSMVQFESIKNSSIKINSENDEIKISIEGEVSGLKRKINKDTIENLMPSLFKLIVNDSILIGLSILLGVIINIITIIIYSMSINNNKNEN